MSLTLGAAWAAPDPVDGRSLRPALEGRPGRFRRPILLENLYFRRQEFGGPVPTYCGIVTLRWKYVVYDDTPRDPGLVRGRFEQELYERGRDPHELTDVSPTQAGHRATPPHPTQGHVPIHRRRDGTPGEARVSQEDRREPRRKARPSRRDRPSPCARSRFSLAWAREADAGLPSRSHPGARSHDRSPRVDRRLAERRGARPDGSPRATPRHGRRVGDHALGRHVGSPEDPGCRQPAREGAAGIRADVGAVRHRVAGCCRNGRRPRFCPGLDRAARRRSHSARATGRRIRLTHAAHSVRAPDRAVCSV